MNPAVKKIANCAPVPEGVAYPAAYLLNQAIEDCDTTWIWRLDLDDRAFPWALDDPLGLFDRDDVDVIQFGYLSSVGVAHVPQPDENYLNEEINTFVGSSVFRRETFLEVGGYPQIAFEDWGLWRKLARTGAGFAFPNLIHFLYQHSQDQRTKREHFVDGRRPHLEELMRECP